ncbi:hypothetical protein GCM10010168_26620 [Actinoplanes ianthinogenes]|uniref:Uncharacterized protein n=1 Tax=Actinoplanes ianthinogenes TaxID=122358 RepID=A0ABM7LKM3_9ACTN|nr:hypothetical protein [Actinoplanes ianthinogenes]BCJ39802.1 hypothetical protein Aiant_04590 [Actinoplanes ianthinogenes]GGR08246.1 hypothetical protein GCM10010168_26620 [Actinoplanes ianthinogenes]
MRTFGNPFSPAYRRVVRASAWYDLIVTAGFMTPWTYGLLHRLLSATGDSLGLGPLPPQEPMMILYANLMGSVVVVWSVLRLAGTLPVHGAYDGVARALFSTWMAYGLTAGASAILWPFLIVEVSWGVVQLTPWLGRCFTRGVTSAGAGPGPGRVPA